MDYRKESLKLHEEWRGKIEVTPRVPVDTREHLSLAYTPGVAEPCMAIHADTDKSFMLTRRWNIVPVITDGTAVLGLGDIGPEAGLPVMEGKCALFKAFGGVDAIPLCIRSKDTDEIVRTIELLAGSFGGINLEDISAPRCFEIEKRLKKDLDIPVFHDDQHGTAVVTAAALLNALKIVGKKIEDINVVINGAGAAGLAIAKFLLRFGVKDVIVCDSKGILCKGDSRLNGAKQEVAEMSNKRRVVGSLAAAMKGADVFVGVSVANCVSEEWCVLWRKRLSYSPVRILLRKYREKRRSPPARLSWERGLPNIPIKLITYWYSPDFSVVHWTFAQKILIWK